ncbi:MAG: hypothetical protein K2N94_08580 [Lachnospiraceae bacterium]|nr:hypothetical protein [Lachnospiraceae bacterium]
MGYWKRCLAQALSCRPSLNRKALNIKRGFDEVNRMLQALGGPPCKKHRRRK